MAEECLGVSGCPRKNADQKYGVERVAELVLRYGMFAEVMAREKYDDADVYLNLSW